MNTAELKLQLISSISRMENTAILEEVYRLLHLEDADDNGKALVLSEEQKDALAKAIKQIEQGDYFTNEQVEEYFEAWLKD